MGIAVKRSKAASTRYWLSSPPKGTAVHEPMLQAILFLRALNGFVAELVLPLTNGYFTGAYLPWAMQICQTRGDG